MSNREQRPEPPLGPLGTAYATTAGVGVFDVQGEVFASQEGALGTPGGGLDIAAADTTLARLGVTRIEPWRESGGQWAAQVDSISPASGRETGRP